MRRGFLLISMLLLAVAPAAWGHALELFAYAEDRRIVGSVYFTSGAVPRGARVAVHGPGGDVVARPEVDADGHFTHTVERVGEHRLVARTGDGHQTEWTIAAAELGATGNAAADTDPGDGDGKPATVTVEREALRRLVEQAVGERVGPLRAELRAHARRARLADIVGGLGGIVGIAGVALWWRARRRGGS